MRKHYSHVTVAISSEEQKGFEKKLQRIKDHFGIESSSTVIQRIINEWEELHWKAKKYEQLRDIFLGFEAYSEHRNGEHAYAEGDERPRP